MVSYEDFSFILLGDECSGVWSGAAQRFGGWKELRRALQNNSWHQDQELATLLEPLLMPACAHYLYKERRRGAALCSVGKKYTFLNSRLILGHGDSPICMSCLYLLPATRYDKERKKKLSILEHTSLSVCVIGLCFYRRQNQVMFLSLLVLT